MGCDIHATIEYDKFELAAKEKGIEHKKWWWAFATEVDIDRNYSLFNILAGVRDNGIRPIIALPRGIPEDASFEFATQMDDLEADGHSHSYVTWPELRDYEVDVETVKGYEFDVTDFRNDDWYKVMEMLANRYGEDNVRLCFAFDN